MPRLLFAIVIGALCFVSEAAADTHVQRFASTGGEQVFVVPAGVTEVTIEAVGGRGGAGLTGAFDSVVVPGGFGAIARATFDVTPGQRLFLAVGGNGGDGYAAPGAGGFNGGGTGGVGSAAPIFTFGGGGGGASDVRTASRDDPVGGVKLITAGGGGGAGNGELDGAGAGGDAGSPGGNGAVVAPPCTAALGGAPGGPTAPGKGGAGATVPNPGIGGSGADGALGTGGTGGFDYYPGGGGGGGGGGLFGGGGGGGGAAVYPGNPNCTPGGGGGGSSGFAPGARNASVAIDQTGAPSITIVYTATGDSAAVRPSLAGLSLTNRAFRVGPAPRRAARGVSYGTAFRFTLGSAAEVTIEIERRGSKPGCKPKASARCARYRFVAAIPHAGRAGANRFYFSGRYGNRGKALAPGRYRATVTATNAAGASAPKRVAFRVLG